MPTDRELDRYLNRRSNVGMKQVDRTEIVDLLRHLFPDTDLSFLEDSED